MEEIAMENPWEVVVVSSNLANRQDVAQMLFRLGIDPICVSSVDQCQEIRRSKNVGLVFCEGWVKDGTYRDVLSAFASANRHTKIVMMSELASPEDCQQARNLGVFDVIPFPCRPTDIEWMVIRARRASRNELLSSSAMQLYKTARAGV
jgi:DNA-binding NtrC family response regulator